MSWQPAHDPKPGDRLSCDAIETVIVPRSRDQIIGPKVVDYP